MFTLEPALESPSLYKELVVIHQLFALCPVDSDEFGESASQMQTGPSCELCNDICIHNHDEQHTEAPSRPLRELLLYHYRDVRLIIPAVLTRQQGAEG